MPTSNPAEILVKHDHWATQQILNACLPLSAEQFNQTFEMGRGSLQSTLSHMLTAERGWTDLLTGREPRFKLDDSVAQTTPAELITLLDVISGEFAEAVAAHPLDHLVSRVREGKTYTFTRGAVLTHVTTHGMHHRAQCLNMLRHLGVKPLPFSSVMEWTLMGDK